MNLLDGLYWLGLIGAAAAVVIYFVQIALLRKWVRLVTGAGLFFSGLGLAEASIAMRALGADFNHAMPGALAVAALLAAVYFQSVAALRMRGERREESATTPAA